MRRARVDQNHGAIAAYFQAHGCQVQSLARLGKGVPDLLVGWQTRTALVEVKTDTGKTTPDQVAFHQRFPVWIVRNESEAFVVVDWLKQASQRQGV